MSCHAAWVLPGRLVLVCGLPGSGKTITGIRLEHEQRAVRLCPDDWMAQLHVDLWDTALRSAIEAAGFSEAAAAQLAGSAVMPARTAGVAVAAAVVVAANRRPTRGGFVQSSSAPQSMKLRVMPAWTMAGPPTSTTVVAAASSPAHRTRIRPDISGSFHGGHLPPPLLRCAHRPRMDRVRHAAPPPTVGRGAISLRWRDDLGRPPEAR